MFVADRRAARRADDECLNRPVRSSLAQWLDRQFAERCISSGLSSGEGLIFEVRDPSDGDSGAQDKRRLIIEPEFAQILKVLAREGNTLSPVVHA